MRPRCAVKARHRFIFARRREKSSSTRLALNRANGLHLAGSLLCCECQKENAVDLTLLANEAVNRVTLDLKEITFADRAAGRGWSERGHHVREGGGRGFRRGQSD